VPSDPTHDPLRCGRRVAAGLALTAMGLCAPAVLGACASGSEPVVQTLPPRTSSTTADPDGGGSTDPGSIPGTTAATGPGDATITSLEVKNQISCTGSVEITTGAAYATEGAASVAFVVDGEQVPGSPPTSGSFDIPLSCDGRSHTVLLVAVDAEGRTTIDSRVVLTSTTPLGN